MSIGVHISYFEEPFPKNGIKSPILAPIISYNVFPLILGHISLIEKFFLASLKSACCTSKTDKPSTWRSLTSPLALKFKNFNEIFSFRSKWVLQYYVTSRWSKSISWCFKSKGSILGIPLDSSPVFMVSFKFSRNSFIFSAIPLAANLETKSSNDVIKIFMKYFWWGHKTTLNIPIFNYLIAQIRRLTYNMQYVKHKTVSP